MCNDKTIKELLPAYREQKLGPMEQGLVESHLQSCQDCRTELSLLRLMAEEAVPDPGEAFWAAMSGRVFRSVQEQKARKKSFGLARLWGRMVLPRWGWAAATVGTALIISLFISRPVQKVPEPVQPQGYEFTGETEVTESVSLTELDNDELGAMDTWAGRELASIAYEAEQIVGNSRDTDIDEELGDLNEREVEQLSETLEQISREG
jgi:Putative zinc-finger